MQTSKFKYHFRIIFDAYQIGAVLRMLKTQTNFNWNASE